MIAVLGCWARPNFVAIAMGSAAYPVNSATYNILWVVALRREARPSRTLGASWPAVFHEERSTVIFPHEATPRRRQGSCEVRSVYGLNTSMVFDHSMWQLVSQPDRHYRPFFA